MDPYLPKDAGVHVHERPENCTEWSNGQWNYCVHPEESDLGGRPEDPDVDERHDSVQKSKEKGQDKTKYKYEEVVREELDVFVREAQNFVVASNRLGALMLVEAFFKIQLKRRKQNKR